jgi:hypothetical protein
VRYTLQYGVHNGRCFVGPLLSTPELVVAPQLGVVALQVGGATYTSHTMPYVSHTVPASHR